MPTKPKTTFWKKIWFALSTSIWTPILLTLVVIGLVVFVQVHHGRNRVRPVAESVPVKKTVQSVSAVRDSACAVVRRVLAEYRIPFRIRENQVDRQDVWSAKVPYGIPFPSLHLSLQEAVSKTGASILKAQSDPATGKTVLQIGKGDSSYFQIHLIPSRSEEPGAAKIALVIDDFGDRLDDLVLSFFAMDGKITISVIPGRKLSTKVAREANKRGCEVILHLAMEPLHAAFREDGYTIMTKMPRADIQSALQKALDQVPGAVGVNNHMGSGATSDRQTMVDLLEGIRQRGLYFVDSYTVASSVAYGVAQELGIPTAKRDVFVDVDGAEEAIRQKLWELVRKARKKGSAIGIGHCHPNMLAALRTEMPRIQKEGLRFVPLSDVVQ